MTIEEIRNEMFEWVTTGMIEGSTNENGEFVTGDFNSSFEDGLRFLTKTEGLTRKDVQFLLDNEEFTRECHIEYNNWLCENVEDYQWNTDRLY